MLNKKYLQVLLSAKLGDGCYVEQSGRHYLQFVSYHLDYITHIKSKLDSKGFYTSNLRIQKSGYKKDSFGYAFSTRIDVRLDSVAEMSVLQVLDNIDIEGLCYFFLDDGSFHQKKHFGHLYCNTFTDIEVDKLVQVFYKFYPQKLCKKRIDKKKDGRSYPYIYIPVAVMDSFRIDLKKFLMKYDLQSFYYKIGQPSQTIERQK